MSAELTAPQHKLLAEVQRNGHKVYDSRQLPAIKALVARGLVRVGVNYLWDRKRPRARRGYKTYTVYTIGEEFGAHVVEINRHGEEVPA